ncbi:MAG: hypothetical protein FWD78_15395 [Treponema sp.]|nr:hypothetical protein [Treponema sp.]
MKTKSLFISVILFLIFSASGVFAQAFLNPDKYFAVFPLKAGENVANNDFVWLADKDNYARFAALSGRPDLIDSKLEFALLSFYSPAVIGKRPVSANTILPANNVRSSALKLGAAVFKELTMLNYFDHDNTVQILQYEDMLNFISEKNAVTRSQIEQYYRANIKSLVTEIVNDEFNKIGFSLVNYADNHRYFITLIRTPSNGRYVMNYEVPAASPVVKTIAAAARETLINELRRRPQEFSADDADFIKNQAMLIPAVAMPAAGTDTINVITAFFLNQNKDTYNALGLKWQELYGLGGAGETASSSYSRALASLSDYLADIGL